MKHIMMACHDLNMYQELEQILKTYFTVSPFAINTDYQETLRRSQPDLLLITVSSSDKEVYKTYDNIMKIPEMIGRPVIFLAKQSDAELERQALLMGAQDYLIMPSSPELLVHRINNCLELIELRKERPYVDKYQDAISFSFAELVECRDVTTGGHLKNTTMYFNVLLQEAMNCERYKDQLLVENTRDLLRSAKLHDIGKLGINDEILRKESTLDFNEYEQVKTHTTLGKQTFERIIKGTGGTRWLNLAKDMAYCHHERWDGTGYPNGLKGEEIPLCARMLTIADVYDALTSDRAYKKAYPHQLAVEIITQGKGSLFDPELVELFVNVNGQFEEILNNKLENELVERE